MTLAESMRSCLGKNYFTFAGRASRSEFWWFSAGSTLLLLFGALAGGFLAGDVGAAVTTGLLALFLLIPSWTVTVRRLHDTGRSGWWLLAGCIPMLGQFILFLFFLAGPSPNADNEYGPAEGAREHFTFRQEANNGSRGEPGTRKKPKSAEDLWAMLSRKPADRGYVPEKQAHAPNTAPEEGQYGAFRTNQTRSFQDGQPRSFQDGQSRPFQGGQADPSSFSTKQPDRPGRTGSSGLFGNASDTRKPFRERR